ncbi:MAG: hypothetical protein CME06_08740 [Gemmatimonadetes bacterium]|nr:hypothetical protein [Gemmatimonadota bacterium]
MATHLRTLAALPPDSLCATCHQHASARSGAKHRQGTNLRRLATKVGEKCGLVLVLLGPSVAMADGLTDFLRLAMERSPEIERIEHAYQSARAAADLERSGLGSVVEWSMLGPSYATVESRQPLFDGSDYLTTDSQAFSYGSSLSLSRRTPWGGVLRAGSGWTRIDLDQTTSLPSNLDLPDEIDRDFQVDASNLEGNVRVTLRQPLFAGNEYRLTRARAAVHDRRAELSLRVQRGLIQLRMAADYFAYQTACAEVERKERRRDLSRTRLIAIEAEHRRGGAALLEARNARLELGREETKVLEALASLGEAEEGLRMAIRVPLHVPIPIERNAIIVDRHIPSEETALPRAMELRPDLALLAKQIEEQELTEDETLSRLGFRLDLVGSLALTGFGSDFEAARKTWGLNEIEVGVGASLPVWDAGLRKATQDGLRAEMLSRKLELELARQRAELEIQRLRRKFETSLALLELAEKNLELARENESIAKEEAAGGALPIDDLREIELALLDVAAEVTAARARLMLAKLSFHHAIGESPLEVLE